MTAVFADSYYFFALLNPRDEGHDRAHAFSQTFSGSIVTSAWVFTELGDGLCSPTVRPALNRLLAVFHADPTCRLIPATSELFDAGVGLFAARPDKHWSLTDCISFVAMQREGLTAALTADQHFVQAGFKALLLE